MNGRVFAKRFVAVALILFGVVCLAGDGETWMKVAAFAMCAVAAFLLFRRTARDEEWKRKYDRRELTGQIVADSFSESVAERERKPPDPQKRLKRFLIGATVLDVVTMPFRVVLDLAKKQK